ncbi:MAG TPA: hypothetical protein ENH43_02410 [Phycisphaerales bacterium]|nr:hypothetical protein [Phycisphaerales bacterium]
MAKMSKSGANSKFNSKFILGLLFLCVAAGCAARNSGPGQRTASDELPQWLVSPQLLAAGKLEILWQNELPMGEKESLEQLFILGNRIYALSDRNYMVSLNREKGNVIFSRFVARAGFPVFGLGLYKPVQGAAVLSKVEGAGGNELFSLIGNKLVEINPEFGTERSVKRLLISATCPIARNSSYFYLGGVDRRMHVLRVGDKVQVFEVAAQNDSMITSIIADEDFVIFATDAGNVISITPDRPRRLWQFDAAGGIVAPIVRDAESLFVAGKDTNVYRVNILTGRLVWKYQTEAVLDRAPRITQGVVYQYVRGKGLLAIDKESGDVLWLLAEGVDLLAEADGKAYVITNAGALVVMDNKRAKQLYSVNFAPVSRYTANVTDSKIYIADKAGRIACLKPVE